MKAYKSQTSSKLNKPLLSLLEKNSIVSVTDSLGRIEYANANFCSILECEPKQLIGEPHELLKSHLYAGKVYKNLWETIKMGHPWKGVLSDTSHGGKAFWLDTTIIPIKNKNTVKYVAVYNDVTHRKSENIELLAKVNSTKDLMENMPVSVFSITRYGKILNVNKPFRKVAIEALIGDYIFDYISPSCYEPFKHHMDLVFAEKTPNQFEIIDFDSNGKKIIYSCIMSPVFNVVGEITSASLCLYEISEFRSLNKESLDNEAKFRTIYQSINVGIIVVVDHKGNIAEWNKGAESAFGYPEIEILGRPLTVLMSKEFKIANIKELLKAIKKIKSNENADIIEMCCLRRNGEKFPIEFALSSLNVDGNNFYCAMMLDITKRKRLENKLKQKTKDLELFLYRSAHDIKAPFSSAEGLLNLLRDEETNERVEFLADMLGTTIKSGKVLADNLTEASIISTKKHKVEIIDFHGIINNVLKTLSGSRHFESIKFNIDIADSIAFKSNPELLNSIFLNLIQNAIKYSNEPTKTHVPSIDIMIQPLDQEVSIMICDNGSGINKNSMDKIFDLYYRTDNEGDSGNGLGLYIVKSVIEGLGGDINVKSDVDFGTCFEINLPYAHQIN